MTLIETILALSLASAVTVGAVTASAAAADRAEVTLAQGRIVEAYRRAQGAALVRGGPVVVIVAADSLVVRALGPDTGLLYRAPGPGARGVSLSPAFHDAVFGRTGLAEGLANVTHRLSRGTASRQVVISRLGRLRTG